MSYRSILAKFGKRVVMARNIIRTIFAQKVVIIYQMGKVGSTSLYNSIYEQSNFPVFQIHRFNLSNPHFVNRGAVRTLVRRLWASLLLFIINKKDRVLITPVRKPLSRNMSDFFQTYDYHKKKYIDNGIFDNLDNVFLYLYPHASYETWFDLQVKAVFGIDIFKKPFDHVKKYNIYNKKKLQLITFRIEDVDEVLPVLSKLVGVNSLTLRKENDSKNKWYNGEYQKFKSRRKPDWYSTMLKSYRTYIYFYD